MKKTLLLFLFVMAAIFSNDSKAQNCKSCPEAAVAIEHLSWSTGTPSCVSVRLKASYLLAGFGYSAISSTVTLDPGNTTNLSISLPSGATLLNKSVFFSTSSGAAFVHTITSGPYSFEDVSGSQLCTGAGGTKNLFIESSSSTLVQFHVNQILGW